MIHAVGRTLLLLLVVVPALAATHAAHAHADPIDAEARAAVAARLARLEGADPARPEAVVASLRALGGRALPALVEAFEGAAPEGVTARVLADALRGAGWRMLRAYFEGALESDADGRGRMRALQVVARLGGGEGLRLALDLVRDYDEVFLADRRVARAWKTALGHLLATDDGTGALHEGAGALARALDRVPSQLQRATAQALVTADAAAAIPVVAAMLDARPAGAAALLQVLAQRPRILLARIDGARLVADYLTDARIDVRVAALRLVGHMGLRDHVPGLVDRLEDEQAKVRRAALRALQRLTGTNRGPRAEPWRTWLESEARWLRSRRIEDSLATGTVAEVAAALRGVIAHPYASVAILPSVVRVAARHEHAGVRAAAVAALRAMGRVEAVDVLVEALQDPAPAVRQGAHHALVAITGMRLAPGDETWKTLARG